MTAAQARRVAAALGEYLDAERRMMDRRTPAAELPAVVKQWVAAGQTVRSLLLEAR